MTTKRKAGRPAKHTGSLGGNTRKVSVTLPVALVEALDRIAAGAGKGCLVVSRSYVVTTLITKGLNR
jgi:metal-responsive CopG/Arc/MetJ family transcriptional regulator